MKNIKRWKVLIAIEILIVIILGIVLIAQWKSSKPIDVSISDWQSDYVEYDSINGWSVGEKSLPTKEKINLIYGPFVELKKGTYRVKIEYHCDYNQDCLVNSEDRAFHLLTEHAILSRNYDYASYDFAVGADIDDFEFQVNYNGNGYIQVNNITIEPTPFGMIRNICIVLFLLICLDLCLLCSDKIQKNRNVILVISGIVFLTSLPLFVSGIGHGHDLQTHLLRIESIAKEIRLGNIPVRLSSSYIDGYGYPMSVYYGDLLLYIPAVMSMLGFSLTAVYKFYVLMINTGTAVITYLCMNSIYKNRKIALLTCLAYCTASYRMVNLYVRAAVGEYSAMMFMPVVAYAVYKIYTDDIDDFKEYRKNALLLSIGMSGLIGTHVLSTEMVVFMLVIVCVSLFRRTLRKNTIKVYLLAILETCAINAYFIIPFIDYYINVPVKISAAVSESERMIQDTGISLAEIFSFFKQIQRTDMSAANERMLLTPGFILMAALAAAIVLWVNGKGTGMIKYLTVFAGLSLFITLDIFPWDYLAAHYQIGNLLAQVQFPWRYLSIASIVLTLLMGSVLEQISSDNIMLMRCETVIVTVGVISSCLFVGNYIDSSSFYHYYDGMEINNTSVGTGEYLRDGTNRSSFSTLSSDTLSERMQEVTILSRRGSSMEIRCIASDEEGFIWIPMFHYKGYHVTDDSGNEYQIKDGANNLIEVSVPIGFDGYLYVEYREPWYWRLGELISLVTVLTLCVRKLRSCRR